LISSHANVNGNKHTFSPIHLASLAGQIDVVKLLISVGANVNSLYDGNITPLHCACLNGHSEIAEILISVDKATLNHLNDDNHTPLYAACLDGCPRLILMLLSQGANFADNNDSNIYDTASKILKKSGHHALVRFFEELAAKNQSFFPCSDDSVCPICYDNFQPNELCIQLPCNHNHIFHDHCLNSWKQNTCPLCRQETNIETKNPATSKKIGYTSLAKSSTSCANDASSETIKKRNHDDDNDDQKDQPAFKKQKTDS
jgi:hypothetical protein